MERLVVAPGQEPQCEGCPSKLTDELANDGYMCREVRVTNFGVVLSSPKMIEDGNGSLVCNNRSLSFSARIRDFVYMVSALAVKNGIQLPQ